MLAVEHLPLPEDNIAELTEPIEVSTRAVGVKEVIILQREGRKLSLLEALVLIKPENTRKQNFNAEANSIYIITAILGGNPK